MAFNPSPEVAAVRDAANKLESPFAVVVFLTKDCRLGFASYGHNAALCAEAGKFGEYLLNVAIKWEEQKLFKTSPTFQTVLTFANRMEYKLSLNRHKGDRKNWLKDCPKDLCNRIADELQELRLAIAGDDPEKIANEAADVANFAMMVADGALTNKAATP